MGDLLAQATAADWQVFPWGTLLTLSSMLGALLYAAAMWKAATYFQSKKDAEVAAETMEGEINAAANALRAELTTIREVQRELAEGCRAATKTAEEAYRMAQLTDRSLGEQWRRVSEEIIQPVKEMARDLRETREMVLKYISAQDNQARDLERLTRRFDDQDRRKSNEK